MTRSSEYNPLKMRATHDATVNDICRKHTYYDLQPNDRLFSDGGRLCLHTYAHIHSLPSSPPSTLSSSSSSSSSLSSSGAAAAAAAVPRWSNAFAPCSELEND